MSLPAVDAVTSTGDVSVVIWSSMVESCSVMFCVTSCLPWTHAAPTHSVTHAHTQSSCSQHPEEPVAISNHKLIDQSSDILTTEIIFDD